MVADGADGIFLSCTYPMATRERDLDATAPAGYAADGADGIFLNGTYPNDPASGPAFATERKVDARPARASDLAVRRGVNSFTRTTEGRSAVKTIEDGVDGPPSQVTYLLR
jgi:hypothetical protein